MAAEPARPEPVLRNGRGHNSERPAYRKKKKIKVRDRAVNQTASSCHGVYFSWGSQAGENVERHEGTEEDGKVSPTVTCETRSGKVGQKVT